MTRTRRQFFRETTAAAAGLIAVPTIVPASALGRGGATAPSERIVLGCIGTGGRGRSLIGMFLKETAKERPLTHDLLNYILKGFSINVERVVITELKNSTYFARLFLHQSNELGRKLVEIDARPSDCLAIAAAQKRPIYVAASLFEQVEDMSEVLERINENNEENEQND